MTATQPETVWEHADDVEALLMQIWESLTENPDALVFAGAAAATPARSDAEMMVASVGLHGDFNGAVHVLCADGTARHIATQMMALSPDDPVDPADVDDALGEVANIIGGNVKSLLDGVEILSLPVVRRLSGAELDHQQTLSGPALHTSFAMWGEEQVVVEVRPVVNQTVVNQEKRQP